MRYFCISMLLNRIFSLYVARLFTLLLLRALNLSTITHI
nr:MAG TPA: hypothetical protein [Caudoviricetes sp.]